MARHWTENISVYGNTGRRFETAILPPRQQAFERRFMYYSTAERILLVGEGDFSFSSCLATHLQNAQNIIATSLDSGEKVLRAYHSAVYTIANLRSRGALVLHGIDATMLYELSFLRILIFDKIVFNFPHTGFYGKPEDNEEVIENHKNLVSRFLGSARMLLSLGGQIHINHKVGNPYDRWNLKEEAQKYGLVLRRVEVFRKRDYPGYTNKRGDGPFIDHEFELGACRTYMFMLSHWAFVQKELFMHSGSIPVIPRHSYEIEEGRNLERLRLENGQAHSMPRIPNNLNMALGIRRATDSYDSGVRDANDPLMLGTMKTEGRKRPMPGYRFEGLLQLPFYS